MENFSEKANFIWNMADLIRDTFKRGKYQEVILPFTVLRRIDCVLEPKKQNVLEVNGETFAICKSDLYMKSRDGSDAENIKFGNTLKRSEDRHADGRFDYMLANPPYGKKWEGEQAEIDEEARLGYNRRFGAGTPAPGATRYSPSSPDRPPP